MTSTVTIMWDFGSHPIRIAHPETLPIPGSLFAEIEAWSVDLEALMWGERGPDRRRGEPDRADLVRLNDLGRSLAQQVRDALDDTWRVTYFDEVLGEETEIEPVSPRPVRRHHGT